MDEDDLERLYTRLERRLANVVYRWVWNIDEAQEIVQEAFVRLWRMRARVDPGTVEPLVYRIALNLASSRRRSRKLWQWVSLEAVHERASGARAVDETLANVRDAERLRDAVDALPEDLRRVIVMCELSEMSYQEIGRALSIPAGTVGSRRHRALDRLRGGGVCADGRSPARRPWPPSWPSAPGPRSGPVGPPTTCLPSSTSYGCTSA